MKSISNFNNLTELKKSALTKILGGGRTVQYTHRDLHYGDDQCVTINDKSITRTRPNGSFVVKVKFFSVGETEPDDSDGYEE